MFLGIPSTLAACVGVVCWTFNITVMGAIMGQACPEPQINGTTAATGEGVPLTVGVDDAGCAWKFACGCSSVVGDG